MSLVPLAAKGTLLKIGNGASTEVFTTIDGVRNLAGPTQTREFIDVTHLTSAGGYRQKLPSYKDAGQLTFDLLFDPTNTQHEALLTDFEDDIERNFQLVFPDSGNATWTVTGYVASFEISANHEDALMASVTIELTGAPVRVA